MIIKNIPLSENNSDIYLTTYISDIGTNRDAILVIPGGGYSHVCADREGEPIALAYMTAGLNAFVLHYSIGEKALFPNPLCDASIALAHIREHAEEFKINPDRIFAVGFSAGGHLAGSLGVMWNLPEIYEKTGIPFGSNRPTGVILGYPVVTGSRDRSHLGSFNRLSRKDNPSDEELAMLSLENHVNSNTSVPMFAFHTTTDPVVPVANPLVLALAYAKEKIPFELHIYPKGPHGLALANEATYLGNPDQLRPNVADWIPLSVMWMKSVE